MKKFKAFAGLTTVALLVGASMFVACIPKSVVKSAADVAFEACRFAYGQHPQDVPPGLSVEDFCHTAENLQPFIDNFLSVEKTQAIKMGTRHEDAPDAGK